MEEALVAAIPQSEPMTVTQAAAQPEVRVETTLPSGGEARPLVVEVSLAPDVVELAPSRPAVAFKPVTLEFSVPASGVQAAGASVLRILPSEATQSADRSAESAALPRSRGGLSSRHWIMLTIIMTIAMTILWLSLLGDA